MPRSTKNSISGQYQDYLQSSSFKYRLVLDERLYKHAQINKQYLKIIPEQKFRSNPDENTPKILELTIDEVINGGKGFFGLIPYVQRFLDDTGTDIETRCQIQVC